MARYHDWREKIESRASVRSLSSQRWHVPLPEWAAQCLRLTGMAYQVCWIPVVLPKARTRGRIAPRNVSIQVWPDRAECQRECPASRRRVPDGSALHQAAPTTAQWQKLLAAA